MTEPSTSEAPPGPRPLRTLIVRLSAVGDVVHTLPVAAALHDRGWQTDWLVEPLARPLLDGNPKVDRVVAAPSARAFAAGAARATLRDLRARRHDAVLDLQGLWKSAVWARLSGGRRVIGFGGSARREPLSSILMRELAEPPAEAVHVIDKNLSLLRALGIDAVGWREFPLPPLEEALKAVDASLAVRGMSDVVLLNPGGGWTSKLWPPESFALLAQGLRDRKLTAIVTWGPGEERLAERVVSASDGAAVRCFPTTLLELAALARRARLVVSADTGPLHLAAAVKTPVVGLFGPTDPARNGPFSPRDVVVRRLPLCAPCHRHRCRTHEGVMEAISPAEVLKAVDRRLALGATSVAV